MITKKYLSSAEIQEYWNTTIAPNFFKLDNINNYRVGIYGYINEVMANSVIDAHNALNIARREFYPTTAQNPQTFYKMASMQKIDLPMATPAVCKAILLIPQNDIIENSIVNNGIYNCVIDNTNVIAADNINFLLDYPITIISKKSPNNEWIHTIHYDVSKINNLNPSPEQYIVNKTIINNGTKYILMSVILHQVSREPLSQLIVRDSDIDTVSMLFNFEGDLANFDVEYIQNPETKPVQLIKIVNGGSIQKTPFCYYRLLNSNLLEISFPKNSYFTPEVNAEIRVDIFTSLGKSGNFKLFDGSLSCSMDSEDYPYNNNINMTGVINGSCAGGKDCPTMEEFKITIDNAYSTNNTITTESDLQRYFDSLSDDSNKVIFKKKRSDIHRQYGAYCLLKDNSENIIPTNTITMNLKLSDFDSYNPESKKAIIKPGTLFEYEADTETTIYTGKKVTDLNINDDLSIYDNSLSRFLFTNPYLISVSLDPNMIGFYSNGIDEIKPVEYSYINDSTLTQFIGSNMHFYRNPIIGENFYSISISISPTSDIDAATICTIPTEEDLNYYFRATKAGKVISISYDTNSVYCTLKYADGEIEKILISSSVIYSNSEFVYSQGYELNVKVNDTFSANDILAKKKVKDLGKIRMMLDFSEILNAHNLYIPLTIENYNAELNLYTFTGYISTDDILSSNATINIDHGIYNSNGTENANVAIPLENIIPIMHIFYKNDEVNPSHMYSEYEYIKNYTYTNSYTVAKSNYLQLIKQINFIQSTISYYELIDNSNVDDFGIKLSEVPVAKANWIKEATNFEYLISTVSNKYDILNTIYYTLENNFGFDMKFYNTYGKSRFYKVGIGSLYHNLTQINCSIKFGVYLSSLSSQETFLLNFRNYVKNYIESINSSYADQAVYIMNLTHELKDNFTEIDFLEYYGFNNYEYEVQKIVPKTYDEMNKDELSSYIPEFVNVSMTKINNDMVPNINVTILSTT